MSVRFQASFFCLRIKHLLSWILRILEGRRLTLQSKHEYVVYQDVISVMKKYKPWWAERGAIVGMYYVMEVDRKEQRPGGKSE